MQLVEPGKFIELNEVEKILKLPAYGTLDLVTLGLFHAEHHVHSAIRSGKLKFQKINKRAVIIYRDDVLEYWRVYRNTAYEPANKSLSFKLSESELNYVIGLVEDGKKRINRDFNKDDLFRNLIHTLKQQKITPDNSLTIFSKRY